MKRTLTVVINHTSGEIVVGYTPDNGDGPVEVIQIGEGHEGGSISRFLVDETIVPASELVQRARGD